MDDRVFTSERIGSSISSDRLEPLPVDRVSAIFDTNDWRHPWAQA
jgi:hypothetical protein